MMEKMKRLKKGLEHIKQICTDSYRSRYLTPSLQNEVDAMDIRSIYDEARKLLDYIGETS